MLPKEKNQCPDTRQYEYWLLEGSDFQSRNGKSCNIRKEFHAKISMLIELWGDNHLNISTYVDKVLADHLQEVGSQMDEVMRRKMEEIQISFNMRKF